MLTYILTVFKGANTKSQEDLKRDQMERLFREELDHYGSNASLQSVETDSRSFASPSPVESRALTAKSMYSHGAKSATSRGRKTVTGSNASLRMEMVRFLFNFRYI